MTTTTPQTSQPERLHQEIELCAYLLYEKRGCQSGHEMEDWLEAEKQLMESPSERTQLNETKPAERQEELKSTKQPTRRATESRRREVVLP